MTGIKGPLLKVECGSSTIEVWQGDITQLENVDAIVNPANSLMIMGVE